MTAEVRLPPSAAWRHHTVRDGFEVVLIDDAGAGRWFRGCTTLVEDGTPWVVRYELEVDTDWVTREVTVVSESTAGRREIRLSQPEHGRWAIDGRAAAHLDGCLDVDLECSALTNAFPLQRLRPSVGERLDTAAAFVRLDGRTVERLDQTYRRLPDDDGGTAYDYEAPVFDVRCVLRYDDFRLITDYPGLAVRAG